MALDDVSLALQQAPLFATLSRDALRLLAFSADTRRLRPDEALFRKGDRSDGGYVVTSGEIVVGREADGQDPVVARPGSLIGQISLFVRMQRPATAVAREASSVLRISPTLMRRVLQEYPEAAAGMHEILAQDLEEFTGGLDRVRRMLGGRES